MPILVLDNGSYEIKIGYGGENTEPIRVTNAITRSKDRRTYIGNELQQCKDYAGLVYRRPLDRGQLVSWECQKAIWDDIFFGKDTQLGKIVEPAETGLILTETPYTLPALSSNMDQIVFEEYGFQSYYRCPSASLVPWNDINKELFGCNKKHAPRVTESAMIIESGFNATNIVPVILGEVYWPAVRRIDVGGRMLTNYLKETVSFRYYNMMDESFLMNVIKETMCFVSDNYNRDLQEWNKNRKNNRFQRTYVLPDYSNASRSKVGYVVEDKDEKTEGHQTLTLSNERFTIPEILFNNTDIGLGQAGIGEATLESLQKCPEEVKSLLMANVVLVGGTSNLPGYKERVTQELQSIVDQNFTLRVGMPSDPISYAWKGGSLLASQSEMLSRAYVTKQDYMEYGPNICLSRFGIKNTGEAE